MGDDQNTVIEEQTSAEETAAEETADEGKSIEEQYNEYFGDDADGEGDDFSDDEDESDEDADGAESDEDADEADGDEDTDEESDGEEAAGLTETEERPREESTETRRLRRMHDEMLRLATSRGYESVEDMLADENGESRTDVEARLDSDEMSIEEKAAAYDRLKGNDAASQNAKREREGKAVHDRMLAEIKAEYPDAASLASLNDVPDVPRFRSLVLEKGLSAAEAYAVVTAKQTRAKAAKAAEPSGKAHMIPDRRKASGHRTGIPDSVLREARDLFPGATDAQIAKMYARVQ